MTQNSNKTAETNDKNIKASTDISKKVSKMLKC